MACIKDNYMRMYTVENVSVLRVQIKIYYKRIKLRNNDHCF